MESSLLKWQQAFLSDGECLAYALHEKYPSNTELRIVPPVSSPTPQYKQVSLLPCKGCFNRAEASFVIGTHDWSKLKCGSTNLLDLETLRPLVSQEERCIHLVTYQNGIQNTFDDFQNMGESIAEKLGEHLHTHPLVIGLYNPRADLVGDLGRVASHLGDLPTETLLRTQIMFERFFQLFLQINPNLRWLHIAHSEGGGIGCRTLETLEKKWGETMRKHLITATYGPLMVIPKKFARETYNNYSDGDNTTLRYVKEYQKGMKEYEDYYVKIAFHESLNPPANSRPPGDHAFFGLTYQQALDGDVTDLQRKLQSGEL